MRSVLNSKITLSITEIGKTIKQNLENKLVSKIGGKCTPDGYIKPNSVKLISYSSGSMMGDIIEFHVIFECMICLPVEGMLIECISRTITKAGIHAQVIDDDGNMPVTVFVARDHHHIDDRFLSVKENTKLTVRVIGIRYELNDKCICAIANLTDNISENIVKIKKPKN
jgi:DNA-directed RNA polymerase subunit E'/Rpb7